MKILFISDDFFGYAREITKALEKRGDQVIWFPDRFATDARSKMLIRLAPRLVTGRAEAYFERILAAVTGERIDQVLVIKAEGLSAAMIGRLRVACPSAGFTLYFWDSFRNMPAGTSDKVPLFDKVYTFDPVDAARDPRLRYRPLFYLDDYAHLTAASQDIDVLFFGTVHTDRYAVVKRLQTVMPAGTNFRAVMYFPSVWMYRFRRVFDPSFWVARRREFIFKPLAKAEVQALMARARIVVDIERPVQSGLTMRTIEMLGASKKLITTNPEAAQSEFYRPENISVVDRRQPVPSAQFLSSAFSPVPESLRRRYSLSGWLDEVLPAAVKKSTGNVEREAATAGVDP